MCVGSGTVLSLLFCLCVKFLGNTAGSENVWSCWINCCWWEKFFLFLSIPTSNICLLYLSPLSLIRSVDTYISASFLVLFASTSVRCTATSALSASHKKLLRYLFWAQMFGLKQCVVANAMGVFKNICVPFTLGNSRYHTYLTISVGILAEVSVLRPVYDFIVIIIQMYISTRKRNEGKALFVTLRRRGYEL
jgi:hypothetical protein